MSDWFPLNTTCIQISVEMETTKNSTNNFIKKMFVIHDTTSDIRHPRARLVFICIHSYNTFCCRTDKTLQILTQVNR